MVTKRKQKPRAATKKTRRRGDDIENFKDYSFEVKITPSDLAAIGIKQKKP